MAKVHVSLTLLEAQMMQRQLEADTLLIDGALTGMSAIEVNAAVRARATLSLAIRKYRLAR